MKLVGALLVLALAGSTTAAQPPIPLASGRYVFQHRFAEHPDMPSTDLTVVIKGAQVEVISNSDKNAYGVGVIDSGTLMWHAGDEEWIVAHQASDLDLEDVGGCSDGPAVIDLDRRIYWTC